ncbi:hypothetical protein P0F65_01905 [Sphingomonas sp. I4]
MGDLVSAIRRLMPEMTAMMGATGFAIVDRGKVQSHGTCPPELAILDIAGWTAIRGGGDVHFTHELPS